MQILNHQHQRGRLAQLPQQPEQQLEQPRLGSLAGRARFRLAQSGQQAGKLGPGRTDQLPDRAHPDIGEQGPQGLHDRSVGQPIAAHGDAAADQHPRPIRGATARQLRKQAGLADAGLAPYQDDGRIPICGPHPGRLQELQLLDTADQGRALHAVAHLAGIIPRDRPERNGGRKEPATKDGEAGDVGLWKVPDSGDTPQRHSELASDDQSSTRSLEQTGRATGKGRDMNNQHAGLSQVLAEQHITQRRQQAAQARLGRGSRPPGRRLRSRVARGWWQLARWPAVAAQQPARRPHSVS